MSADRLTHQIPGVEKPVFIVGTGRCGSSAFHRALASHPQTAWLSRVCESWPQNARANRWAMQTMDLPLPAQYRRKLIYPVEAYQFWDHHSPGFSSPNRDLHTGDVTPSSRQAVRQAVAQMLTARRRRLIVKITGWPRIGFLKEIFPDAKFIHVYRDGRAVANSYLAVSWWSGWRGPDSWQWGGLSPEQREKWERFDWSYVALAAIQWEILMTAQRMAKEKISSDDLLEIRYEDMCQDPKGTFKMAAEFSDLTWSPHYEAAINRSPFENTNYKWRKHLTTAQQKILNECLCDMLREYDYV